MVIRETVLTIAYDYDYGLVTGSRQHADNDSVHAIAKPTT